MIQEQLKQFMGEKQLRVSDVMHLLHVSERTVYQWLKGGRKMPEMACELLVIKAGGFRGED